MYYAFPDMLCRFLYVPFGLNPIYAFSHISAKHILPQITTLSSVECIDFIEISAHKTIVMCIVRVEAGMLYLQ